MGGPVSPAVAVEAPGPWLSPLVASNPAATIISARLILPFGPASRSSPVSVTSCLCQVSVLPFGSAGGAQPLGPCPGGGC
eukprot:12426311-Karenia_brevis.AAC.1